jgi:Yip1 domain
VPDTLSPPSGIGPAAPTGLAARIAGVIFSPGETYRSIAAHPRVLGVLAVTTIVMATTVFVFLSTEVGQNAALDYQYRAMESLGINVPDEVYDRMEQQVAGMGRYISPVSILVTIPVICALVAGIMLLVFNVVLGGDATFKQAYAIVAHSQILLAVQQLFILPLNYARETMASATTVAVFLPMLDETSFFARFLGWIDLFRIWWLVSLAIGAAVLYKRKSGPIAWTLLGLYVLFALVVATALTAFAGA